MSISIEAAIEVSAIEKPAICHNPKIDLFLEPNPGIPLTTAHLTDVLLVFSYLIIPAVCANVFTTSLKTQLAVGWLVATLASVAGLYASYRFDLPTGAAIVCALGLTLLLTGIGRAIGVMIRG